jgi:hypothetical protein
MSSFRSIISRNAGTGALLIVLGLSLGLNVYLGWKVRFPDMVAIQSVKVNTKLPSPLALLDPDGKPVSVIFEDSRPTVLYVLSPVCGWCKRNEANIKALTVQAGSRFHFVGLSMMSQGLKDYVAQGRAPFPVYAVQSQEQAAKLGLSGTPETIVVGPGARVEREWMGAHMDDNQKQIEQFFDVKLPGLQEVEVPAR